MKLPLVRGDGPPLYRQIVMQIRALIEQGSLSVGSRLPTVRQLAVDNGLTRLTVQNAYAELHAQGWTESTVGRGTFVCQGPTPPSKGSFRVGGPLAELLDPGLRGDEIMLAQATPATETYPLRQLKASMSAALQQPGALSYGPIQGDEGLREQLSRLLLQRGMPTPPEHVLITGGAQQALDLALRALTESDQTVAVEVPAYAGVLESLRARHQPVLEIPVNLPLTALEEACRRHRPKLLYTVPNYHNPTGQLMSAARRSGLLELSRRYEFLVLEDDVYGFLGFDGPTPAPLRGEDRDRVVYLTSFSKTLSPALRMGALVASPPQLAAISAVKQATDLICSPLLQKATAEFLRRGYLAPHLLKVCKLYRDRRDALVEAMHREMPGCLAAVPLGGLSAWVELPPGVDEEAYVHQAQERGLILARGQAFFYTRQERAAVRISFGSVGPRLLSEAVRLLAGILENTRQRRPPLGAHPLV